MLDESSDAGSVEGTARQLIRDHEEGASQCAQCHPAGWCEVLSWARTVVLAAGLSHPHG